MHKEAIEELDVRFKLLVLDLAEHSSVTKTCREFNVPRSSFYRWKKKFDQEGPSGLYRKKPIAYNHPNKTPSEVVAKILEIRREYQMGALRIKYYLERYHGIKISEATVSRTLNAHGVAGCSRRLPNVLFIPKGMQKRFQGIMFRSM